MHIKLVIGTAIAVAIAVGMAARRARPGGRSTAGAGPRAFNVLSCNSPQKAQNDSSATTDKTKQGIQDGLGGVPRVKGK